MKIAFFNNQTISLILFYLVYKSYNIWVVLPLRVFTAWFKGTNDHHVSYNELPDWKHARSVSIALQETVVFLLWRYLTVEWAGTT